MKKITVLALHLGYGGIEKAIANLVNGICDNYEITIVSTYKLFNEPFFKINSKVKIEYLLEYGPNRNEFNAIKKSKNVAKLLKESLKAIKILKLKKQKMIEYIKRCDSDIIISTRDIHNEWLGKYGSKKALKIGWEHNHHNNNQKYIDKIVDSVENLDYFVLVSGELCNFYQEQLVNTKCKCYYIPNSLDFLPDKISPLKEKNIISIGRLSKEKGFTDLIDIMYQIHQEFPDWKLKIIGGGDLEEELNEKIKKLHLEDTITLTGFQKREEINEFLSHSSLYVMTSLTESFGIVLLEAFSYGIPCLAYNTAQGANELIKNNMNGYLIPDRNQEEMVKRIKDLIVQDNKRRVMGLSARRFSLNFDYKIIAHDWEDLFEKEK